MEQTHDQEVQCPSCGEWTELQVDAVGPSREQFVQDCEVCCRPWTVTVSRDGEDLFVQVENEGA